MTLKNIRFFFVLPVLLVSFFTLQGQWSTRAIPYYRDGNGVDIIDGQNAAIAGGNLRGDSIEIISLTNNAGGSWNINQGAIAPWLKGIKFANPSLGISVGALGTVLRTTDQGNTWMNIHLPGVDSVRDLNSICFADANTVYAVGGNDYSDSNETVIRSIDGGISWSIMLDTIGSTLRSVQFVDIDHGYAVGDNGLVLKTTDGGNTWNTLQLSGNIAGRNYNALYFFDHNTGFIVGGYPANDSIETILHTTDGGSTWNVIMDQLGPMLNAISFADSLQAYVVGNHGKMMKSDDRGNSWNDVISPVVSADSFDLNSVCFLNSGFGIAVGKSGVILQFIDSSGTLPVPGTLQATNLSSTRATLHGLINTKGINADVWFDYGPTIAMGDTMHVVPSIVNSNTDDRISAALSGLTPNSFYYYRLVAASRLGVFYGNIVKLYTTDCEIPNCGFEVWDSTFTPKPKGWNRIGLVRRVASYNGSFAAEMYGDSVLSNGAVSGILLGNTGGNNNSLSGGIPFSAKPDSVNFHARFNVVAGDTAFMVFFLKKNDQFIDSIFLPVTGNSAGNWTSLSIPIVYHNPDVPDTLEMGILNSNGFSGHPNFRSTIAVDDITFAGTNQLLPDWNFEQWDSIITEIPQQWFTDNVSDKTDGAGVFKTTDNQSGNYALLLTNRASIRVNSDLTDTSGYYNDHPAFPVAGRHNTFNGYFKFLPEGGDTLAILVNLFHADTNIAAIALLIDTPLLVYTPISADFAYTYPGVPDSGNVSFSILNRTNSHPGTMVFIDDLSFDGFTSDITKINELHNHSAGLEVYPNPASGRVNILTGYQGENNISVYDLQGELVFRGVFYGGQFIFDCGNLSSGVYVVRILNGNYISTEKMVIAK